MKPASEQLRELGRRWYANPEDPEYGAKIVREVALALPELIAVVKAAEFYLGEHTQGRPALTIGIEQALDRLAAKLSGEAG